MWIVHVCQKVLKSKQTQNNGWNFRQIWNRCVCVIGDFTNFLWQHHQAFIRKTEKWIFWSSKYHLWGWYRVTNLFKTQLPKHYIYFEFSAEIHQALLSHISFLAQCFWNFLLKNKIGDLGKSNSSKSFCRVWLWQNFSLRADFNQVPWLFINLYLSDINETCRLI